MSVNRTFSSVYLPIVPVIINDQCKVYALLDTGSTNTFVTQRLATQLKLKGKEVSYSMSTLGHSSEVSSKTVSTNVTSVDANEKLKADNVLIVGSIPVRYPTNSVDINVCPHLADLPMSRVGNDVRVDVLIGMDNAFAVMPLEVRCGSSDRRQPYATRTLFGWSLNGPVDNKSCLQVSSHFVDLGREMDRLLEVEALDEDALSLSYEVRKVPDLWDREIEYEDEHDVIPIPWKDETATMPNNKYAATSRLNNLISCPRKTEMLEEYSGQLKKMEMDGYAEKVPVEETYAQDDKVCYLPHHAVVSAAKHSEVCLHNQCIQGPELVTYTVCRSFYADDMLRPVGTREEAADVIRGTKQELKYDGLNLTKYMVNDTQLLESIVVTDQAKEVNVGSRAEFSRNLRQRDREKVVRAA